MDILPKENQFVETLETYERDLASWLSDIAQECQSINKKPSTRSRNARLLDALQETFELIGGVPRMAFEADKNPMEFYKLWGKQIPGVVQQMNFNGPTQINIQPALPRSPLDGDDSQNALGSDAGNEYAV